MKYKTTFCKSKLISEQYDNSSKSFLPTNSSHNSIQRQENL